MSLVNLVAYVLIFVAAISAVAVVFVREVFHAALLLLICLLSMAGLFVVLNAEFIAVVQIIVYAGGVLLLMMFGLMLTNRLQQPNGIGRRNEVVTIFVCLVFLSLLVNALGQGPQFDTSTVATNPNDIGAALLTTFAFPFELAGILLLISLIGAMIAATQHDS